MAMRLSGKNCRISTICSKDGRGHTTHVYCISRSKGLKCPLEVFPGVKPFELTPLCFEVVRPKGKKD